jgi:aspartokinase/homoserine dehydrogenase 1
MTFDSDGLDLDSWSNELETGACVSPLEFFESAKKMNLRNSVFVDVTANASIAETYAHYLKESIAVIACNKIACSGTLDYYQELKQLSIKYNAPFLFETNVGAGLPVIDTLNNLVASGDQIQVIYAVLSGSLNFIFNNYKGDDKFANIVKQAQLEGYTEPDPRIDLSGVDVARKLLILARESGVSIDMEAIENSSFLPNGAMEADSVKEFYTFIESQESVFKAIYEDAKNNNAQLKYVAEFKDGIAKVGLQFIKEGHPFFNLEGKDNIVMFYTNRYKEQPLIVKGAGAGAEVTASGLFGDIIRASSI